MSEDMVEKVAKAIFAYNAWVPKENGVSEQDWDQHLVMAYAAIEALMKPTPEMCKAMLNQDHWSIARMCKMYNSAEDFWQAMLRAALNQPDREKVDG